MERRERQRTYRGIVARVGVATLLTWTTVAYAEGIRKNEQDDITTLKEVVVRSTALDNVFLPLNASIVEETTVHSLAPATSDAASLLRDIPGVSLYGAGGISSLPVIHGLADDRLRIKVDGMDLISACPNHMTPPLSYVDPSAVGSLSVFAGITPVSVGGDSIGGTILLESPLPVFAAPGETPRLKGEVGGFYRSNNKARGGHYSGTYATEMFSATYSGSVVHADNYTAGGNFKAAGPAATDKPGNTLDGDEVGSSAYKAENHNLTLALKKANHLFEAKLGYQYIPEQGFPNQRMDIISNTEWRQNLRYLGQFGWGSLDARAYHETIRHDMDFGDDKMFLYGGGSFGPVAPGMPMNADSRNLGGVIKASIDLTKQHTLRVGGEYQYYRLHDWWPPSPAVLPSNVSFTGMAPNVFRNINDGTRERKALFTEWEARVHPQWLTLLGARYERVEMDAGKVHGYNDVFYKAAADTFNARNHDRNDNNWDITALARFTPFTTLSLEFGYAHKMRSPNLYERYAWSTHQMAMIMNNFVGDGNGYVGNLDLDPEKAHTLSGTIDWHTVDRTWEFKVSPYYTHVTDYIDAKRCVSMVIGQSWICGGGGGGGNAGQDKFVLLQYVNQTARLWGVDVSGHLPLANTDGIGAFHLIGLFNYTNGKNRTTGDDLYNIMPLNGKLMLGHKLGGFDSSVEMVAAKGKNNVSDVRSEIKTAGYILANFRTSYNWTAMRLDFGIENMFDKYYSLPLGGAYTGQGMTMSRNGIPWGTAVPGMGRTFYTALTYKF